MTSFWYWTYIIDKKQKQQLSCFSLKSIQILERWVHRSQRRLGHHKIYFSIETVHVFVLSILEYSTVREELSLHELHLQQSIKKSNCLSFSVCVVYRHIHSAAVFCLTAFIMYIQCQACLSRLRPVSFFLYFWTLLVCQIGQDFSPWVQCIKKFAWLNPHCLDIMSSYCCRTSYIHRTLTSIWRKWVALDTGVIMS